MLTFNHIAGSFLSIALSAFHSLLQREANAGSTAEKAP
jgi:hypothetical protein